jgi:hypothetical protein
MAKKRECITCGEKYSYCPNCNRKEPAWKSEFHDENCKNIFQICTSFNVNIMTKHEAKAALEQCDLSNKENFKSFVQRDLENIFKEEPKPKRGKRAELPIFEEALIEHTCEVVE